MISCRCFSKTPRVSSKACSISLAQEASLFDHFVGGYLQALRHREAERLAVLRLITSSNFVGCWTGRSAGVVPLRI